MFRRSSSAGSTDSQVAGGEAEHDQEAPAQTRPAGQAGKGRPTPKRNQAERNRYRSIQGGTTSGRGGAAARDPGRKATPEEKQQAASERIKRTEAMKRGEEWALGSRDAGPVRRFARDYVDSHRRISNYMMAIILLMIVALPALGKQAANYMSTVEFSVLAVVMLDAYALGRTIRKQAAERFPGETTHGVAMYAGMRALQLRFMRFPKPQVKPGDKI